MVASRVGEYNVLDGHWGAWWKSNPKYLVHYANVTPKLKFTVEEFLEKEPKGKIPTEDIFTDNRTVEKLIKKLDLSALMS